MAATQIVPSRLSNIQIELLKLYPYSVSEKELGDIRKMLADYFAQKIDMEMDQLWEQNNWNEQTVETWKSEHLRSKISK
ncbi:hypothetical protein [Dyadobacter alkalitolerans]|uniref:hypothetical protein n=1 Tax=Dyadobacter alkalitolerans TaxID=492736 RepID=UPI00041AB019|nr:hypothetical protein [Dyadobacter alkalitolerans]